MAARCVTVGQNPTGHCQSYRNQNRQTANSHLRLLSFKRCQSCLEAKYSALIIDIVGIIPHILLLGKRQIGKLRSFQRKHNLPDIEPNRPTFLLRIQRPFFKADRPKKSGFYVENPYFLATSSFLRFPTHSGIWTAKCQTSGIWIGTDKPKKDGFAQEMAEQAMMQGILKSRRAFMRPKTAAENVTFRRVVYEQTKSKAKKHKTKGIRSPIWVV